jgi:predicted transcriptional regulator
MERSEIVKLLEEAINEQLYQDYQLDTETVSFILKKLEDAGYQPLKPSAEDLSSGG